ncbi:MAG: DNA primase regulatory subunit PriL [Candidatus Bathyarchaeia archaeon]
MKTLNLKIDELASPEYAPVVNRAEKRVEEAILYALVSERVGRDQVEILSFPIAVMMTAATGDPFLKRRYALAEAKRAYNLLRLENKEKIMEIAKMFNWEIKRSEGHRVPAETAIHDFSLRFTDFLRNTANFHEKKWKLVNRLMHNGYVYLTKDEAARLIAEEVRIHVEKKLDVKGLALPQNIAKRVSNLKQLFARKRGKIRLEEMPREVVVAAFPPCIKELYNATLSGRHCSHVGRFALTSFLLNTGMTVENVVDLFRTFSDFNERMTRYQVEHIAGGKGSRTKYIPPKCETLRTHGVCPGMDEICREIRHPLAYYRRKLRILKTEAPVAPGA